MAFEKLIKKVNQQIFLEIDGEKVPLQLEELEELIPNEKELYDSLLTKYPELINNLNKLYDTRIQEPIPGTGILKKGIAPAIILLFMKMYMMIILD